MIIIIFILMYFVVIFLSKKALKIEKNVCLLNLFRHRTTCHANLAQILPDHGIHHFVHGQTLAKGDVLSYRLSPVLT